MPTETENQKPERLRTPEAAHYCGLAARTFEKLRVIGGGPNYIKIGRAVVYDTRDLDQWVEDQRSLSDSGAGDAA